MQAPASVLRQQPIRFRILQQETVVRVFRNGQAIDVVKVMGATLPRPNIPATANIMSQEASPGERVIMTFCEEIPGWKVTTPDEETLARFYRGDPLAVYEIAPSP